MKQFLIKTAVFAAIVVLVDYIAGLALDVIQHKGFEKNPLRFEVRAMNAIEKASSELDIIGASDVSHNYVSSIITDSIGLATYNYGKDGCFFVWQNCLINLMLDRHTPRVLLWEIGKDCLSTNSNKKITDWQKINDFYPYYRKSEYCRLIISNRGKYQKLYMLSGLYRHNSDLLTIIEPFIISESIDPSLRGYIPLPNNGYIYPTFNDKPIEYDMVDSWKAELLNNTLDVCNEKGIKVFFCFSPKYRNEHIENTNQWKELRRIAAKHNVPFIDFENCDVFMKDSSLFKDNVHLNDKGARLYMELFIPELKSIIQAKE